MPPVTSLRDRLIDALADRDTELWLPDLANDLVEEAESALLAPQGMNLTSYSTGRWLDAASPGPSSPPLLRLGSARVEVLTDSLSRDYRASGIELASHMQIDEPALRTLAAAWHLVSMLPSLARVVDTVVRAIHIVLPPTPDHDVSHSDPALPFSVFVSVAPASDVHASLRVAESIIHEAMHLLLTLVERHVPLAEPAAPPVYSPWLREHRPATGVLHGLYVFSVIQQFYEHGLATAALPVVHAGHVSQRLQSVRGELREARRVLSTTSLTPIGRALMERSGL